MGKDQRSETGQATVELALVLPIVVFLALAVAQIGVVVVDSVLVHHAAREAARAAAVEPTQSAARQAAHGASGLNSSNLKVGLSGGRTRGDHLTVTANYRSATTIPLVGRLIGDVDLRSSVTIRVE